MPIHFSRTRSVLLYPPPASNAVVESADTGKHEPLQDFNSVALEQLNAFLLRDPPSRGGSAGAGALQRPPALAAAMTKALCYINTVQVGEASSAAQGGMAGSNSRRFGAGKGWTLRFFFFFLFSPSSITDGARHPSSWKETAHIQQRPFGYSILAGVCVLICANAVLLPCIP